jgi:hypothetical protein
VAGPAGAGGGLSVYDASGNNLGVLVSIGTNSVTVFKNGWFVPVDFSGYFPVSQIWWTDAACSGTGYLNDGTGSYGGIVAGPKVLVYSGQTNALYSLDSATSIPAADITATENAGHVYPDRSKPDGSSNCTSQSAVTKAGWKLNPFDAAATLGWTVMDNPLHVAGPLTFQ